MNMDASASAQSVEQECRGSTFAQADTRKHIVVVTGLSGAGKQSVLRSLEDAGFDAIDNMPMQLWGQTVQQLVNDHDATGLALGLDVRSRGFAAQHVLEIMRTLRAIPEFRVTLIYLDADDEVLQRRFNETRRRHPLALDRDVAVGISEERAVLASLRDAAELIIDTSKLSLPDLRNFVASRVVGAQRRGLAIHIASFAYKNGLPRSADLVFDVRFLRNPHYDPVLRAKTGRDAEIQAYVREDPDFAIYWQRLQDLLAISLDRYGREGKSYLTIAVGCSGGKHRSVFLAESLAAWIAAQGRQVTLRHQELNLNFQFQGAQQVVLPS